MKIVCPSKAKEPYRSVIAELSLRAGVSVEFVKNVAGNNFVVLDEGGEPVTPEKIRELVVSDVDFLVGGPDGIDSGCPKISLGK